MKENILFNISSKNVHESNLFLRKLWSELDKYKANGWYYINHRQGNLIEIGFSNYGKVSFDYKVKGCINNIYFDNIEDCDREYIKRAVKDARRINETIKYYFDIYFLRKTRCTTEDGLSTHFYPEREGTCIRSEIEAYSDKDFQYLMGKKLEIIKAIISVYLRINCTLSEFKVKYTLNKPDVPPIDKTVYKYDDKWIDFDEVPMTDEKEYIIPKDMVQFVDLIIKTNFYPNQIQMMINSAQTFFSASIMKSISEDNYEDIRGYISITNAMVISALEPLANLEDIPNYKCEYCGTTQFHVLQKMRTLINRYYSEEYTRYMIDTYYTKRSKFFHEGSHDSDEYYIGICWPQIDENCCNEMENPRSIIDWNLFNEVSFILRKRYLELINEIT